VELWILWSIALYFAMVLTLKGLSKIFGKYYYNKAYHLVMITLNNQHRIEWMIWSYHMSNEQKRKKGTITCIDVGSVDDTLSILQRLQLKYPRLQVVELSREGSTEQAIQEWLASQTENKEKLLVLDLREPDAEKQFEKLMA
jgi:hypothetical protein